MKNGNLLIHHGEMAPKDKVAPAIKKEKNFKCYPRQKISFVVCLVC